jgi:glycosyltransferase family protein
MILQKIKKELERFKKRLFYSAKDRRLEELQFKLDNLPYEIYDKTVRGGLCLPMPTIKTVDETLNRILQDKCSLSRFGDGEFGVMNGSRINYQNRSPELAARLKEVITSNVPNFLIGLPDCFGSLDDYLPAVGNFWQKWMSRKRKMAYSYLDMNRVYYNANFSRVYMQSNKTEEHYRYCGRYYEKIKKIWEGRDVVLCEGEKTRFGMYNDLLAGAKSISRILCPARSAFDKYDAIVSAFEGISTNTLVLASLGPTATVLAYDLCQKGYQAIDIGALDLDYEWFLRKEIQLGAPVKFKYVDGSSEGRNVSSLEDVEYQKQIIKKIV